MTEPRDDLLPAVQGLAVSVGELKTEFGKIETKLKSAEDLAAEADKKSNTNRLMIWGTIASVVFDLLLTLVIFLVADDANDASQKATEASQKATMAADKASEATSAANESLRTQKVTCEAGNVSRKLNRDLWDYVLSFPPADGEPRTSEEEARTETFRTYISTVFADRDCENLGEKPESPTVLPTPIPSLSSESD